MSRLRRMLPQWRPDIASADYQMAQIGKIWAWMLVLMLGVPTLVVLVFWIGGL